MSPIPEPRTDSASAPSGKSLTTLAFDRLRSDILVGHLRPDERLKIQALSDRYGIGATAIREALSRLVSDGLVESEDQRGFAVASISREDLIDLTNTRMDVEGLALRRSIERGDVEWEANIVSSFHRLSRAPLPIDPDTHSAWAAAHRKFHESLVAGCGSPWLLRLCRMLSDKSERYRNLAEQKTTPEVRNVEHEHRELMNAAFERDADKAKRLLAEHFQQTTDIILRAGFRG
jgi:GntR family transcriptional regulator, carbon starvation induced regulator